MARRLTSLLIALLVAGTADGRLHRGVQLDSIRCGTQVVSVGARAWELVDACGDPDFRDVVEIRQGVVEVAGPDRVRRLDLALGRTLIVEEWVYRLGRGRLTRVLTVVGGVLTDIRVLGRD